MYFRFELKIRLDYSFNYHQMVNKQAEESNYLLKMLQLIAINNNIRMTRTKKVIAGSILLKEN